MHYKSLGSTGLKVSAFGLGCGSFGGIGSASQFFGKGETEQEAFALMDEAYDLGINFFDTANAYGGGRSETYIGKWLRAKGSSVRQRLLISSKVFNPVGDGPNDWGLSRKHIMHQVDASLTRLAIDYLDMYLIHDPDPTTPLKETLHALDDVIRQGKVRYIGTSNLPAWLITKSLWLSDKYNLHRFEWVQNTYNLLDRSDEGEMFALIDDQRLGYTPFGPLSGGLLTGKYSLEKDYPHDSRMSLRPEPYLKHWNTETFAGLQRLQGAADQRDVSMAALSLAWVMNSPHVTAPLVGPRKSEHFEPLREALTLDFDPDERSEIANLLNNQPKEKQ